MWLAKDRATTGPVFGSVGQSFLIRLLDFKLNLRLLYRSGYLLRHVGLIANGTGLA
jgi:hypothetical protein